MHRFSELPPLSLPDTTMTFRPRLSRRCRSRRQALRCAVRGWMDAWQSQPNVRLHVYVGVVAVTAGIWCRLAVTEWLWVSFAIGLVLFAELMNTAIEQTVDLVVGLRPDPAARQVKDIAAGFVLVASILAAVIGTLTFLPHVLAGPLAG